MYAELCLLAHNVWYNHFMEIVRIIIFVLLIIYLLLALVFVHISLNYRKQLNRSSESLQSLFAGQIALFQLLTDEFEFTFKGSEELNKALTNKNFQLLNKQLADTKLTADAFAKKQEKVSVKFSQIIDGLNENVTLIRNEVYRYNKIVENLNINRDSVIFSLFVVMLRLHHLDKI